MKIHRYVAVLAALSASGAFATTLDDAVSMRVDDVAPIRATLLPTVTIEASMKTSDSTMRVAETKPLEVTLLPTVHVSARGETLATTLLPTVRVTPESSALVDEGIANTDDAVGALPGIDDAPATGGTEPLALRARAMPR